MVLGLILLPVHAHVTVELVKALRDPAAPVGVALLRASDIGPRPPTHGLRSRATPRAFCIAAAVNLDLRAGLDAGIALPAHIRLDVEGAPIGRVDVHDVGRADIDTMPAAVAARHIHESRHDLSLSSASRWIERRSVERI